MPGPAREWVTIPIAGKERRRWEVDVTFLSSRWECIFERGCQGVFTELAPERREGCCSYGAHAHDRKDREHVERAARRLKPEEWQFRKTGREKGVWVRIGKKGEREWRTRLVKDACIFLNRADFEGGPGCALHVLAERTGRHFSETKPLVCWQLPIRTIDREEDDGSVTQVLTEFGRDGWGEGGEEFAWWCTEEPAAFVGGDPVYKSLETELRLILGDAVYEELAKYLGTRCEMGAPLVQHPAETAVTLDRGRRR